MCLPGSCPSSHLMRNRLASLNYPHERVLLARTKLAYVHLRNLISDAKRDRAARVFGYVAIWLPDELVLLYMQEGELVNATVNDGESSSVVPIANALERVPAGPEYGEVCFHEADDEQLACMYSTHAMAAEAWPPELNPQDPAALFPYLMATTYDGILEVVIDGHVNFLVLRDGAVERGFLSGPSRDYAAAGFHDIFAMTPASVRRWPVPPPLPVQAAPALIQAYRELTTDLVWRLEQGGKESAPVLAEQARITLLPSHPVLDAFRVREGVVHDPVTDTDTLTAAVAAWVSEIMWAGGDLENVGAEDCLRELTKERRHVFQSAGFFERLPWAV
jgi:hypothetical protein